MIEFSKQKLSVLIEKINSAQNIAVITHTNPDGDTVGASLSIYKILLNMGKKVSVISPDTLPEFLECLPNVEAILTYETQKNDVKSILQNADLVFCMDFNASHRVGILTHQLDKVTAFKILIDHHLMPDENFFDLIFSFDESSSTSELLFHLLRESDLLKYFDSDIATCIYVGIMTDTGSFSFACNRKEVFETVARLVELGDINLKKIHDNIYNSFSESRLRFLGFCINEKLVVLHEYHAAYIWVSMEEMERFNVSEGRFNSLTPILLGMSTFFLPCGFTQSMQVYALTTGDVLSGAMTMLVFSLGTLPVLALISFASVKLSKNLQSGLFFKTAGFIIIFFAIFNLLAALVAVGLINPLGIY